MKLINFIFMDSQTVSAPPIVRPKSISANITGLCYELNTSSERPGY